MSEEEWNGNHPAQNEAHIEVWTEKQKRSDYHRAELMLVICQAMGVKIGKRSPRMADFLPQYAQPEKDVDGDLMKLWKKGKEMQDLRNRSEES